MGEPFRHGLRVRFHECDPQGVVFYANYLAYFDIAITELWREAVGGGYEAMTAGGIDMMVAEARIEYLDSLRFDDEVELVVSVAEMGTTSLVTRMAAERDGQVVARGELRHVFIATADNAKTPIPERVRSVLERYVASPPD